LHSTQPNSFQYLNASWIGVFSVFIDQGRFFQKSKVKKIIELKTHCKNDNEYLVNLVELVQKGQNG
jgi:hypothetical protein